MSDTFLIVKRGLFFRPNCQGYTGIRDEAGRYSEEVARYHAEHGECTLVALDEAPEFMPAAYNDLVIKHLTKQRDTLQDCLQSIAEMSDEEPREPDDSDWRFRCLSAIEVAKRVIAVVGTQSK